MIADLKNNLSRHLTRVRRGNSIVVLDRNTPIARIVPYDHADDERRAASVPDRMGELVRDGIATMGDPDGLSRWMDAHPAISRPKGMPSAVEALVKTRRESTR